MSIIRRENLTERGHFSFADLEAESRAIIDQARAEAARIRKEAHAAAECEAAEIRTRAEAEGRAAGQQAGHDEALARVTESAGAEARTRIESLCQGLGKLVEELRGRRHTLLAESERGMLDLALAIAGRICRRPPVATPETAIAQAGALLELVGPRHELVVEMHPGDLDLLEQAAPDWLASPQAPRVQAAEDLASGDCRLRSPDGTIDATIAAQLERIAAALCPGSEPSSSDETDE